MDKQLHKLTEILRAEKCPPRVRQRVQAVIEEERGRRTSTLWTLIGARGFAVLFTFGAVLFWMVNRPVQTDPTVARVITTSIKPDQAAQEAFLSLAYVGAVFLESGKQAESSLLEEANEPVRSGYHDIRNFIIKNM